MHNITIQFRKQVEVGVREEEVLIHAEHVRNIVDKLHKISNNYGYDEIDNLLTDILEKDMALKFMQLQVGMNEL